MDTVEVLTYKTVEHAAALDKLLALALAGEAGYKRLAFNSQDPKACPYASEGNGLPMGENSVWAWPDVRLDGWPTIWRIVDACGVGRGGGGSQQYCLKFPFAEFVGPCVYIRTKNKWRRTEGRIVGGLRGIVRKHFPNVRPTPGTTLGSCGNSRGPTGNAWPRP
jgi:hypothetical protein